MSTKRTEENCSCGLNREEVNMQFAHLQEQILLQAKHFEKIHELDMNRLNAIRTVDVQQIKTDADRSQTAITALATITASNAETLRNTLTNTASTIATQTATIVSQITERIATLEKTSYEGAGKQAVTDPAIAQLVNEVRGLRSTQEQGSGRDSGVHNVWVWVFGGLGSLVGLSSAIALIIKLLH
jgi:hypothetical protein